jgi:arabinofuranosyltransferase
LVQALDSDHPPVERDRRSVFLLLLTILASAAFSVFVVAQNYWLDDSFITFRYFRNLFEGNGLLYNIGESVEGYTNFLWGVVGWLGLHLGHEPIHFTQWVSVGAQAVTLWTVYRIGLSATNRPARALLAPLLLGGQIAFLTYPMTGMETSFFTMLVTLSFHLFQLGEARTRAGSFALGCTVSALCMTRFDGFVLIGIMGVFPLLVRRQWRSLRVPLVMFLVTFTAYNAWRFSYYPTPLPNSFYAKISFSIARSIEGLDYVVQFFAERQLTLALALLPFVLRRTNGVGRSLGWVVVIQLAYVVTVGGDWMPHHRFIFHVLPLLMLLVQQGAWVAWDALTAHGKVPGGLGGGLLGVLVLINLVPLYQGRDFQELTGEHFRPEVARVIGLALDKQLPQDLTVAIEWGGILPYYTHHNVLDTFGITDFEIAHHEKLSRTIWGRRLGPGYLAKRAPDVIIPCAAAYPTAEKARASVQLGGKSRYGYYMKMEGPKYGYQLRILKVNQFTYCPLLVREGSWVSANQLGPDPTRVPGAVSAEAVPYQVSLFWGGGDPKGWKGRFAFESELGDPASAWTWRTDFEEGDALVMGLGMESSNWALPSLPPPASAPRSAREALPRFGGLIRSKTQGDADGACFSIEAHPATRLTTDIGATKVSWTLSDLAEQPRTVAVDSSGNAIHAVAQRLDQIAALERDHHGDRTHRVSLHTHSRFSTNPFEHEELLKGMAPFVRRAWFTDHNTGTARTILGGDFEDPAVVNRSWPATAVGAQLLSAGRVSDSRAGTGAYRLSAQCLPDSRVGSAWTEVAGSLSPSRPVTLLSSEPELKFSWKPTGSTIAFATVQFSSDDTIRYLSARPVNFNPANDILLPSAADEWSDQLVSLGADYARLRDGQALDCFAGVQLGVLCTPGVAAEAAFDEIELVTADPSELIRQQKEVLDQSQLIRSHVGMEQSAWCSESAVGTLMPHLTFLAPGDPSQLFPGFDRDQLPEDRRALVAQVQAAGGCVGTHHLQLDNHYDTFVDNGGLGVDLFEIGGVWAKPPNYRIADEFRDREAHGYPSQPIDEVYPLLVRWDRLTAQGLFLTGYGAPDLNGAFDEPTKRSFNRWLTSIVSADDSPEGLLRALRSGNAVASEWRSGALVTLDGGDGLSMGKVVVTDKAAHTVVARISDAPPGSRLRYVVGPLVRDTFDADVSAGVSPVSMGAAVVLDEAETTTSLEVDTSRGCFVRAELLNPAGHLIALSNPVCFLPYWPERWLFGRVAFDWQGVRLAGEDELLLDAVRVSDVGSLLLSGTVFGDLGTLQLSCATRPTAVELSAGSWSWDGSSMRLMLTDLPRGEFSAAVTFAEPLGPGQTADPLALPRRKRVLTVLDVGDPASESGRQLSGFGEVASITGAGSYRVLGEEPGEFVLPVPVGEATSLAFERATLPPSDRIALSGTTNWVFALDLLMDGKKIGTVPGSGSHVIELPAMSSTSVESVVDRRFTLVAKGESRPMIDRILLYGGPGVVEF